MGRLANTILTQNQVPTHPVDKLIQKGLDWVGNKFQTIQNLADNPTPYEQQAQQAHPIATALASGVGYVGGMTGLSNLATKPLAAATGPLTQAIIPKAIQGPVLNTAVDTGLQSGILGAASNPDHPVQGFGYGLSIGLPLGAIGGAVGSKLKRSGDVVDYETQNLTNAGVDPYSNEGTTRILKALKDNGLDMSKYQVQKVISAGIQNKLDSINPVNMIEDAPSKVIANLAKSNFKTVSADIKQGFQPIRDAKQTFQASSFNNEVQGMDKSIQQVLPKQSLPENPTINDMWKYRERLDDVIQATKARAMAGNALKSDVMPLNTLRNALTEDMVKSADQIGLKDQFLQTEQKYINQYLPFKSFNTASGKIVSPEDVNDAMSRLNILFKARNVNINQINNIAKSLGPNGNELIGKAMLENMYRTSLNDKGVVTSKTFFTQLKKYNASGLAKEVWGPATKEAAQGISKILDGADEAIKMGTIKDATSFYAKLPSLISTRPGLALIRAIGSSKTPQTQIRSLLGQLISGTAAIGYSKEKVLESQQPQDSQTQ
jgi:hypothetical protein